MSLLLFQHLPQHSMIYQDNSNQSLILWIFKSTIISARKEFSWRTHLNNVFSLELWPWLWLRLPNSCSWSFYQLYLSGNDGPIPPSSVAFAELEPVLHQLFGLYDNVWFSTKQFNKFEWHEWIGSIYWWVHSFTQALPDLSWWQTVYGYCHVTTVPLRNPHQCPDCLSLQTWLTRWTRWICISLFSSLRR